MIKYKVPVTFLEFIIDVSWMMRQKNWIWYAAQNPLLSKLDIMQNGHVFMMHISSINLETTLLKVCVFVAGKTILIWHVMLRLIFWEK